MRSISSASSIHSALKGQGEVVWLPAGGWRSNWPDLKFLGYMDPEWKGVAWAPMSGALAKRRFWVVEGVPKDKYYLYGRIELYIDKVTFQGAWNRKFCLAGRVAEHAAGLDGGSPKAFKRPDGKVDYSQSIEHGLPVRRERQGQPGDRRRDQVGPKGRV